VAGELLARNLEVAVERLQNFEKRCRGEGFATKEIAAAIEYLRAWPVRFSAAPPAAPRIGATATKP